MPDEAKTAVGEKKGAFQADTSNIAEAGTVQAPPKLIARALVGEGGIETAKNRQFKGDYPLPK